MLGGAFATFTISAGLMHSYAVFLVAFLEDFRWSRSDVSLAYSASQLVAGVSAPLVGALVDRLGPRRLVLLGGRPPRPRSPGERLCEGALAHHRPLRHRHDHRSQLSWPRGLRAAALPVVRAPPGHGHLHRPVGEWIRSRRLRYPRPAPDLRHWLAPCLPDAGGAHGGARVAACRLLPRD